MTAQLTASDLTKSYEGRLVLDSVDCSVPVGECLGIVGENGSGKSTLLRLLAGAECPDRGEVVLHAEGGVGYLAQEESLPPHLTVQQVVDRALAELRALERDLRRLEARMAGGDATAETLTVYADTLTAFELRGGYDADARVERSLHSLGLPGLPRERAVGGLSGGEAVRLRLAVLLAAAPEVLLLDEPTNHLDGAALTWLEDQLRGRRGITVVVSHDRVFLERVATSLLEVDGDLHRTVRYGNGYAGYLAERAAERRRRAEAHTAWRAETARLRETATVTARRVAPGRAMKDGNKMAYDRAAGRVQQSLASRVRNAEERLARLLARPVPAPADPLRFTAVPRTATATAAAGPAGSGDVRRVLLAAAGVAVEDRLAPVDVTVPAGGRLLVTGPNGAGKSTLLHVLSGALAPDLGQVVRHGRTGLLAQHTGADTCRRTLLAAYAEGRPGTPEEHAERLLSLGLFTHDRLSAPVGSLSVGQRQRLALARLVTEPTDVLLLDEPTNHLSPTLAEELEEALARFTGAVVVVSHDRRLCARWPGDRLALRAPASAAARACP
ncbi:ABC-F family ATP-binding cassette domain-containing protein [Streptomyces avidinii]|uniref:Macrolide transport system ATP-binding/permease protein n=1 Tax=Streptomyces avidinii TaxID=1895 RepID=A0ABS4KYJ9_STRAV|nr:ABC-F family ATP-binding cassette domain-containing protein [Streptomyces avidinii]MBP2034715.1 macrolide transport system ATP-binding/permease protein [Streptomyces avidinii]GGY88324.1 ABC transporter ATP-binding protein [Streptomyces avidinii]